MVIFYRFLYVYQKLHDHSMAESARLWQHLHLLRQPGPNSSPPLGAQHQFQGQRALEPWKWHGSCPIRYPSDLSMSIDVNCLVCIYKYIYICVCPYYLSSFFLSIPILSTLKILNLESIFGNLVHHGSSFCCSCSKVPATKAKAAPGAAPENERWVIKSCLMIFDDACLFLLFVDCFSRWWLMIIDN